MLRTRAAALAPPVVALALAGAALVTHAAVWGAAAPWRGAGAVGTAPAAAGAALAAAGAAWGLWAWLMFRRAGTPVAASGTPLQLIEEGPYRFGRNPMYLGMVVLLLGAAMALWSPPLAVGALLFAGIVNAVHIPLEEAQLNRRFGGWYRDYAGATRRWL